MIDSALYQGIRPHNNSSLQSGYSTRLKKKNLIKPLFLGGSHKENDAICASFVNGLVSVERLLEYTHEEADDRIFFHANHAIKIGNYGGVVNASPDTDIFVSALHHFCKLNHFDLEEL